MENEAGPKPDMTSPETNSLLYWKTPEFIPMPRGKTWFTVASIIVISLIAYAIYTDAATMAIVFILLAGLFFMTHNKEPRMVEVRITPLGVHYDDKFYAFNTINAFWVVYHEPFVRVLYLRMGVKTPFQYVKIELNGQNPVDVRRMLAKEIPEAEGMGERMIDIVTRIFRLQ